MKYLLLLTLGILLCSQVLAEEDYTNFVQTLKQKITETPFKHSAYSRLAYIVDTFGPRIWGSTSLEQVIFEVA